MPTEIGIKNGYLAKGDAISPSSQGPDEPVVNETSIMTATKFREGQDTNAEIRRFASTAQMHGGFDVTKKGRLFVTAKVVAGTGDTLTITPALAGYDTTAKLLTGHCPLRAADVNVNAQKAADFLISTATSSLEDVPYEAAGGTEYNVGIALSVVPSRATANTRTGKPEFDRETAVVGVTATPASVAYDSGTDVTTFTLSSEDLLGAGDSLVGRAAMAWFTDPTTGGPLGITEVAIVFGTITNTGSNILAVSGGFGQTTPSTTAAEYRVCVLGPAIWSSGAAEDDVNGVAHIAYGANAGGWDADLQRVYPTTFALLENFISMLAPSVTSTDLVSLPKISIRPNDNEAGTTKQIEVWKDAAATSLAFSVDKDGTLFFDGDILAADPTSPLSFGVDDANQASIERAANFFHTYNAGNGADSIGAEIGIQIEDEGGNRIDVGQISAQAVDATAATIDSILKLGRVEGSSLKSDLLIDSKGAVVIEASLANLDVANFYNRVSGSSVPALTVLGGSTGTEPFARLRIWNHTPSDISGNRQSRLQFYGNQDAAGTRMALAELVAAGVGSGADDIGSLSFHVNDGVAAEPTNLPKFLTLNGQSERLDVFKPIRMNAQTDPVMSDFFRNRDTTTNDLEFKVFQGGQTGVGEMRDTHLSTGSMGVGNILRNTYALEDGSAVLDVAQDDSIYLAATDASREFKVLAGGALETQLVLNGQRKLVAVLEDPTYVPFDSANAAGLSGQLSAFQTVFRAIGGVGGNTGIDIANDEQSDSDDDRVAGINFLGRKDAGSGGTRHRTAGIRASHDGAGDNYYGKLDLFVNGSAVDEDEETHTISLGRTGTTTFPGKATAKNTAKYWGLFVGTTLTAGTTGVTATNPSTGKFIVTLPNPVMASTSYSVLVSVEDPTGAPGTTPINTLAYKRNSGTTFDVYIEDTAGAAADANFSFEVKGVTV